MATIKLGGNPIHTAGELPSVGAKAPDFVLTGNDLKDVSLADFAGKKKILNIVPSLDTSVCATSTRPRTCGRGRREALAGGVAGSEVPCPFLLAGRAITQRRRLGGRR